MKRTILGLLEDTLFRNSLYLMLATGVMAFFGFLFWLSASQFFSPAHVGIATTLIAVMNMIALLSLVGFDTVFIRFLPSTEEATGEKNRTINTGFITVGIAAILTAGIFLLFVDTISPTLGFINDGFGISLAFILFSMMTAFNALNDAIFLAHRKAKYTFIINTTFSALRLLLLFLLIDWGFLGIFFAVALSQVIGLLLGMFTLSKKFHYTPTFKIGWDVLKKVRSYSSGNYLAGILLLLPATVLPIMVTNHLGPAKAAFYGVAMMIGNLLYAIAWTTTRALFAEGSHDPNMLKEKSRRAFAVMGVIMVPAIAILCIFGEYFLGFFGKEYSSEGFHFLQLVAVTGVAVFTLSILETFFRVMHSTHWLIVINTVFLATIWIGGYLLLSYGLIGIGIAWLLGHTVASIVSYIVLLTSARSVSA